MKNKYFEKIYNCYEKCEKEYYKKLYEKEKDGFAFGDMNYEQFKSFMKDGKIETKNFNKEKDDENEMIQNSTLVINGINFDTYLVKYSTEKSLMYECMLNISYKEDDEVWGINNLFKFSSKDEKKVENKFEEIRKLLNNENVDFIINAIIDYIRNYSIENI